MIKLLDEVADAIRGAPSLLEGRPGEPEELANILANQENDLF